MKSEEIPSSKSSRSIERGVQVLEALSKAEREISLIELSQNTDLNQSTVYRILTAFKKYGYVEQNRQSSKYYLGPKVISLSYSFMQLKNIHTLVIDELTKLRDYCGETVHYAVRSGNEVVYVEKIQGVHPVGVISNAIGQRNPLHCTAVGKVLLAWLPDEMIHKIVAQYHFVSRTSNTIVDPKIFIEELRSVRIKGYAENNEEIEIGVAAIAAPVFDRTEIVGAVSVSGPVTRLYEIVIQLDLAQKIKSTCTMISRFMTHRTDDFH